VSPLPPWRHSTASLVGRIPEHRCSPALVEVVDRRRAAEKTKTAQSECCTKSPGVWRWAISGSVVVRKLGRVGMERRGMLILQVRRTAVRLKDAVHRHSSPALSLYLDFKAGPLIRQLRPTSCLRSPNVFPSAGSSLIARRCTVE